MGAARGVATMAPGAMARSQLLGAMPMSTMGATVQGNASLVQEPNTQARHASWSIASVPRGWQGPLAE